MINLFHARVLPSAVMAVGFAAIARIMGSVTTSGAFAGLLVAFLLMLVAGFGGFLPLLTVFLLTVISTRWGFKRKQRLGVAERKKGRKGSQVLANLGAAALCVVPVIWFPQLDEILLIAAAAALAEAAADTVSSEMGQATARSAYMITNFRGVPIGTDGAVSIEGTLSGCIAASIVAWMCAASGFVEWHWTFTIAFAAIGGMLIDSILGATWERSGKIGNDAVNFTSTVFAADVALIVALVSQRFGAMN